MGKDLKITNVDEVTDRRFRFLAIGLHLTMGKMLEMMVNDYWKQYGDKIMLGKKEVRAFKKITKRHPVII